MSVRGWVAWAGAAAVLVGAPAQSAGLAVVAVDGCEAGATANAAQLVRAGLARRSNAMVSAEEMALRLGGSPRGSHRPRLTWSSSPSTRSRRVPPARAAQALMSGSAAVTRRMRPGRRMATSHRPNARLPPASGRASPRSIRDARTARRLGPTGVR